MKVSALLLVLTSGLAYGQAPASTATASEAPAKTVEGTASPELVGQLVNDLGVTPAQAEGAAGTLFGLAKTRLSADQFGKVASAVPNMDGLLKAAPAADASASGVDGLIGKAATSAGGIAAAAGSLSKLGLKTETISRLAPSLVKAVRVKGGPEVANLLAGALK
jgi:hypothetical protein